jgi:two-component system OmpR family response regulator
VAAVREPRLESGGALRVLVVDDEPASTGALARALRQAGFETCEVLAGGDARHAIDAFRPDLVVFGVMLPDPDGLEFARRRHDGRERPTPVICTTPRHATGDGLADRELRNDRVTNPFDLAEVVARLVGLFHRTVGDEATEGVLRFDDVVLNDQTHEVARRGAPVQLSPTEFNLLRFFLLNPRLVLSKRQILDNVWRDDFSGDPRVVETYVSYLRKKLDRLGPPLIQTVRLVGYALRDPPRP